jgi:hypothetical protein
MKRVSKNFSKPDGTPKYSHEQLHGWIHKLCCCPPPRACPLNHSPGAPRASTLYLPEIRLAQSRTVAAAPAHEETRRPQCVEGGDRRGKGCAVAGRLPGVWVVVEKWIAAQGAAPGIELTVGAIE